MNYEKRVGRMCLRSTLLHPGKWDTEDIKPPVESISKNGDVVLKVNS